LTGKEHLLVKLFPKACSPAFLKGCWSNFRQKRLYESDLSFDRMLSAVIE